MQNKEYKNTKRTLITAIAILIVTVFALSTTAVLLKHFCSQPKNNNHVATIQSERYDFRKAEKLKDGRYRISNEDYGKYNEYSIYDLDALKIFAQIVNTDNCESTKVYKSFEKKTVYLEANIDCGGAEISIGKCYIYSFAWAHNNKIFKGNFEGNGYTISNFKSSYAYAVHGMLTSFYAYFGFFPYCCGAISNLRLSDFKIYYNEASFDDPYGDAKYFVGTLVGCADTGAKISNCIIENFNIDCEEITRIMTGHFNLVVGGTSVEDPTITQCYLDLSNAKISYGYLNLKNAAIPESYIKSFISNSHNNNCVIKGASIETYSTENKNTSEKGQWVGLSNSSEGGSGIAKYWYYGGDPDYNDGWLYPRQFITNGVGWKDVTFKVTNGSVPESIQIPKDANKTYSWTFNSSTNVANIKIYNQTVSSSSAFCHSEFETVSSSSTKYVIKFNVEKINVIINVDYDGTVSEVKKFTGVDCGHTPSISYSGDSKKASSIIIDGWTYEPDSKYYISNAGNLKSETLHDDCTLEIEIKLKKYSISVS